MTTITIPAKYSNGIIKPLKKIKENPSSIYITVTYGNKENIGKNTLSNYLKSDEYKNDKWNWFVDTKNFIDELNKYKN